MQIVTLNDNSGVSVQRGFPGAAQKGFLYARLCLCVCVCPPHPPLQCDSLPSDMQQRAFTNPHCRTERGLALHTNQTAESGKSTGNRENRERCCNSEVRGAEEVKAGSAPPPHPAISLHLTIVFTSAAGLSPRPG